MDDVIDNSFYSKLVRLEDAIRDYFNNNLIEGFYSKLVRLEVFSSEVFELMAQCCVSIPNWFD